VLVPGDGTLRVQVSDLATDTAFIVMPVSATSLHPFFLPDGTPVEMQNLIVTSNTFDSTGIYVQNSSRSWGIQVVPPSGTIVYRGSRVFVRGTIQTANGHRYISVPAAPDGEFTVKSTGSQARPIFMVTRRVGKSSSNFTPTIKNGSGTYNAGLLVTCFGRIGSLSDDYMYIDDGSRIEDVSGFTGLRVKLPRTVPTIYAGDYVKVTGISSTTMEGTDVIRTLCVRNSDDIVRYPSLWGPP
jgi:hypothetical protein